MGGHDDGEPTGARRTMQLAALASRCCPSPDAALVAVAGAFRPCDDAAVDRELDALALPLFGLEGVPEKVGPALAELYARRFEADLWPLDGLWIDHVLAGGAGHPLVLAAIGAEVARRAGAPAVVCSSQGTWYAGLPGPEHMWLVEPACAAAGAPPCLHGHCGHELAHAALTQIGERCARDGDAAGAVHARALRATIAGGDGRGSAT